MVLGIYFYLLFLSYTHYLAFHLELAGRRKEEVLVELELICSTLLVITIKSFYNLIVVVVVNLVHELLQCTTKVQFHM